MRFIVNTGLSPSFNLALEEEVLLSDIVSRMPAFCLWRNKSSVIVGVSQVVEDEVNLKYCSENRISVVRRHTGGGAVYHDLGNLNFSFFFPSSPSSNPYHYVHSIFRPIFKKLGIEINVSTTNDLLHDGKKFSGMAQRVIGDRVLVHGTMLFDTDFEIMTRALTTEKSKFNTLRGVASRRATVTNLKGYLGNIDDITELADVLETSFVGSDERINVSQSDDFIEKVKIRAQRDYPELNKTNLNKDGHV